MAEDRNQMNMVFHHIPVSLLYILPGGLSASAILQFITVQYQAVLFAARYTDTVLRSFDRCEITYE